MIGYDGGGDGVCLAGLGTPCFILRLMMERRSVGHKTSLIFRFPFLGGARLLPATGPVGQLHHKWVVDSNTISQLLDRRHLLTSRHLLLELGQQVELHQLLLLQAEEGGLQQGQLRHVGGTGELAQVVGQLGDGGGDAGELLPGVGLGLTGWRETERQQGRHPAQAHLDQLLLQVSVVLLLIVLLHLVVVVQPLVGLLSADGILLHHVELPLLRAAGGCSVSNLGLT